MFEQTSFSVSLGALAARKSLAMFRTLDPFPKLDRQVENRKILNETFGTTSKGHAKDPAANPQNKQCRFYIEVNEISKDDITA